MNFRARVIIISLIVLWVGNINTECRSSDCCAVSLKSLQKELQTCAESGVCPDQYFKLGGLTQIDGYVIDETNQDIILFGESLPWEPALYTEDFVIALRNAWIMYYTLKGNTKYYANPGCSIDPASDLGNRLNAAMAEFSTPMLSGNDINALKRQTRRQIERFGQKWETACRAPQHVVIFGIPRNSRFARTLVQADYYMKSIANGNVRLNIDDFYSLMSLRMADIDKDPAHSGTDMAASMTRFWFYPGNSRYLEADSILKIEKCPVFLKTHLEYSSSNTKDDPVAKEFTRLFSERYDEIAELRPTFR
jgi:hypothetical protein